MQKDERDLLDVLKEELAFIEQHGYRRSPETAWRPKFIFEDSPSCINCECEDHRRPCTECALIYLVPAGHHSTKAPCRHIPLNESGETLEWLYQYSNQSEIESTVVTWLRGAIAHLEEERIAHKASPDKSLLRGIPLYTKQHPKCANPACATAFHWMGGGKFFRFRPEPAALAASGSEGDAPGGIHGVRHYWLCEQCSHLLTLTYEEAVGVVVKVQWPEITAEPLRAKAAVA